MIELLEQAHPGIQCEVVEVTTRGDRDRETPLHLAGGVGFFVKGLEMALLGDEIDLAVHSLKDMPSRVPPGLVLGAVPVRGDARDALISQTGATLMEIPTGASVGTGSPRRQAQILARRPDLRVVSIRGNVDTRLRKLESSAYDAIVLAVAGMRRLGRADAITEVFAPEFLLPAAGQGALAIEIRADDEETQALVAATNHLPSWAAATAERAFMARLGAGCHVPAAAYAVPDEGELWLRGLVAEHQGKTIIRGEYLGSLDDASRIGEILAEDLFMRGARALLEAGSG